MIFFTRFFCSYTAGKKLIEYFFLFNYFFSIFLMGHVPLISIISMAFQAL